MASTSAAGTSNYTSINAQQQRCLNVRVCTAVADNHTDYVQCIRARVIKTVQVNYMQAVFLLQWSFN